MQISRPGVITMTKRRVARGGVIFKIQIAGAAKENNPAFHQELTARTALMSPRTFAKLLIFIRGLRGLLK